MSEMDGEMRPYVIRQGDYLTKLAYRYGFDAEVVWTDPANEGLRQQRTDYDILAPGDVIYIPAVRCKGLPLEPGITNRYVARIPRARVALRFIKDGQPLSNEPFLVGGIADPEGLERKTDGDGCVDLDVPVHQRELTITFHERRHLMYTIRIGEMDPEGQASGIRKRLHHLGFYGWLLDDAAPGEDQEYRDQEAISAFQRAQGIPCTGLADPETVALLAMTHGS